MRVSELDKMIAYLKNFADCLDDKGVKTIKKRHEAATSKDANT